MEMDMFARLAQGAVFEGARKRAKTAGKREEGARNAEERNGSERTTRNAKGGGGHPMPDGADGGVGGMERRTDTRDPRRDIGRGGDAVRNQDEEGEETRSQHPTWRRTQSNVKGRHRNGDGEAPTIHPNLNVQGTEHNGGEEAGASDPGTILTHELANRLRKKYKIHVSGAPQYPAPLESFEALLKLGIPKWLYNNIQALGFEEPTPIQRQAITVMLAGHELFAVAPTGSGKTLSFLIPMLVALKTHSPGGIRAVIVSPTKELGQQTHRVLQSLIGGRRIRSSVLTKGSSSCVDLSAVDILVATPLRLSNLINEKEVNLATVTHLVLDEADKLFELGFLTQLDSIIAACNNDRCLRAMYSATLPEKVEDLAKTVMIDPVRVTIGERNSVASTIQQTVRYVGNEKGKLLAMRQILKEEGMRPPTIVFVQSKERAKQLFKELLYDDVRVGIIHADRSQAKRNEVVEDFRAGKIWVLIATDVLARGMDFKGVNCIVNYDFPQTSSSYIHRIGRSGRAGRSGYAITLFTDTDASALRSIVNIMRVSGCDVPAWMLELRKTKSKNWKVAPRREPVGMES